jgi:hypothetical protein
MKRRRHLVEGLSAPQTITSRGTRVSQSRENPLLERLSLSPAPRTVYGLVWGYSGVQGKRVRDRAEKPLAIRLFSSSPDVLGLASALTRTRETPFVERLCAVLDETVFVAWYHSESLTRTCAPPVANTRPAAPWTVYNSCFVWAGSASQCWQWSRLRKTVPRAPTA